MFDAVIFDWDGTLADTRFAVVSSFQTMLKEIGCEVEDGFVERLIGIGAKNTFRKVLEASYMAFTDEEIEELVKKKIEVQMKLTTSVKLFEGAVDLLSSLYGRTKIALASMSNRKVIDKLLSEKGIIEYFDVVVTADEVLRPKPNPEVFLVCAFKLEVRPEKCVVVEDSIFGIEAAKHAGMKCIAIPTGAYAREELEEKNPDRIVDSLRDKSNILNFIARGNKSQRGHISKTDISSVWKDDIYRIITYKKNTFRGVCH